MIFKTFKDEQKLDNRLKRRKIDRFFERVNYFLRRKIRVCFSRSKLSEEKKQKATKAEAMERPEGINQRNFSAVILLQT